MFYGRKDELEELKRVDQLKKAGLIVCLGRRRIGKSTLIHEFGSNFPCFLEIQGLPPRPDQSNQDQLDHFAQLLCKQMHLPAIQFKDWADAFSFMASQIDKKKTLILLDEISWLGAHDPDFPGKLKIAWDTQLKHKTNLRLVLCGSVSSWIQKNILQNTNFMGRISLELTVGELPISDCQFFWGKKAERISAFEKFRILSLTGGIPRYLEEINYAESAEQNIKNLCFKKTGFLYTEFDKIFNDIFEKRAKNYRLIVQFLADGNKNFSEICRHLDVDPNGITSEYLNDLELSGFVRKEFSWDLEKKTRTQNISKYRLTDNYLRFYLKYIEPQQNKIQKNLYKLSSIELLPNYEIIMGLQLENLVLNNLALVLAELKIPLQSVENAGPFYQTKTLRRKACQIDLLIQTRSTLYICEIKYRKNIGNEVLDEVKEKIEKLKVKKTMSVRPILIHVGELSPAIEDEDYFDQIINLNELMTK